MGSSTASGETCWSSSDCWREPTPDRATPLQTHSELDHLVAAALLALFYAWLQLKPKPAVEVERRQILGQDPEKNFAEPLFAQVLERNGHHRPPGTLPPGAGVDIESADLRRPLPRRRVLARSRDRA